MYYREKSKPPTYEEFLDAKNSMQIKLAYAAQISVNQLQAYIKDLRKSLKIQTPKKPLRISDL